MMKDISGYLAWYVYVFKKVLKPRKKRKEAGIVWDALKEIEKGNDFSAANRVADNFLARKIRLDAWDANALFFMVSRSGELVDFMRENPDLFERNLALLAQGEYRECFKVTNSFYRDPGKKRFYLLEGLDNANWLDGDEELERLDSLSVVEVGGIGDGLYASAVYGYLQYLASYHGTHINVFVDKRLERIYSRTYRCVRFIPCSRHYSEVASFADSIKKAKCYHRLPRRVLSRYFDNAAYEEFRKSRNVITSMGIIYKVYGKHYEHEWDLVADEKRMDFLASRMPRGKKCGLSLGSMNMSGARSYEYNKEYEEVLLDRGGASFVLFSPHDKVDRRNVVSLDVDRVNDFESLLAMAKSVDFFVGDATTNTFLAARAGCPTVLLTRGALGEIYRSERGKGIHFMRNIKCMNALDLKDVGDMLEQLVDIINSANPAARILQD